MDMITLALDGAWKVLAAGLVLGAGLPALFALSVRGMAMANGTALLGATKARPWGRVLAWALLAVILLAVAYGLMFIVATGFGKTVSFEHVFPLIVDKKK